MKLKIEVDCTPEEARTFLGLPDVTGLNAHLVDEMKKRKSRYVVRTPRSGLPRPPPAADAPSADSSVCVSVSDPSTP